MASTTSTNRMSLCSMANTNQAPHCGQPVRLLILGHRAKLGGLLLSLVATACSMSTDTFDSATWKAQRGVSTKENQRIQMAPALRSRIKAGMSRAEVIQLLGEPDSRDAQTGTEKYLLGLPMGPDEQYYEIQYQNGVVSSARLGQF